MDASALASAESWLSWIAIAKLVAAFLVAAGVVVEFGSEWISRPFEATVKHAREVQVAALEAATETARKEIATANAEVARANERTAEIEKLTAWRHVLPEQNQKIVAAVRDKANALEVLIEFQIGDTEAFSYGREIGKIFFDAGVDPKKINGKTNSYMELPIFGLHMAASPEINGAAIADAFASAGISLTISDRDLTRHLPAGEPAPNLYFFVAPRQPPPFEIPGTSADVGSPAPQRE